MQIVNHILGSHLTSLQKREKQSRSASATQVDAFYNMPSLLHKWSVVPVANPFLSRFWNRDKASGTKASRLLFRVVEPGQKVPDVKIFFAHHGIRSQDLLPSAYFPCQLTMMEYEGLRVFWVAYKKIAPLNLHARRGLLDLAYQKKNQLGT